MNAEIIAVGTELLLGFTINDDAAYVGRVLAELGIHCFRHVTIGDNPQRLAEAIRSSLQGADLVVTCGGLGPTVDDVTLETIAAVTGRKLLLQRPILRQIRARFKRMQIRMPASNRRQALIPKGAVAFPNTVGTAPGFLLKLDSQNVIPRSSRGQTPAKAGIRSSMKDFEDDRWKYLIALPGPPAELIPMLRGQIVPHLRRFSGKTTLRSRTLKVTGRTESEVDAQVRDLLALQGAVTLGIYAHPGQVDLRITARAGRARTADQLIGRIEAKIRHRLGSLIYGADDETLEGTVGRLLRSKRLTLSVAESCTGGLIQHRITEVPGSSDYLRGGVVAYANSFKTSVLLVRASTLSRYGAVSPETAGEMARGIRRLTGSDLGLAVTGIAGPTGGTKTKPVGLVFIALSTPSSTRIFRHQFSGSRAVIKFKASQAALDLVRLHLSSSRKRSSRKRGSWSSRVIEGLPSTPIEGGNDTK